MQIAVVLTVLCASAMVTGAQIENDSLRIVSSDGIVAGSALLGRQEPTDLDLERWVRDFRGKFPDSRLIYLNLTEKRGGLYDLEPPAHGDYRDWLNSSRANLQLSSHRIEMIICRTVARVRLIGSGQEPRQISFTLSGVDTLDQLLTRSISYVYVPRLHAERTPSRMLKNRSRRSIGGLRELLLLDFKAISRPSASAKWPECLNSRPPGTLLP